MGIESMPMGSEKNGITLEELNKPGNAHLKEAYERYSDMVAQEQVTGRPASDHDERMASIFGSMDTSVAESIQNRVHDHSAIKLHDGAGREIEAGNDVSENVSFMPAENAGDDVEGKEAA